jgi:hypothetical protein
LIPAVGPRNVGAQERPSPGKPTGLTAAIERLADAMAERRAWMDASQAAGFLGLSYDEFTRISSRLPRHQLPEGRGQGLRPRYRYYAPELTEWMLRR